jgi:hypothetical protein
MPAATSTRLLSLPPLPRTRLIARQGERAPGQAFLRTQVVLLLTVTGPGGATMTGLALTILTIWFHLDSGARDG